MRAFAAPTGKCSARGVMRVRVGKLERALWSQISVLLLLLLLLLLLFSAFWLVGGVVFSAFWLAGGKHSPSPQPPITLGWLIGRDL